MDESKNEKRIETSKVWEFYKYAEFSRGNLNNYTRPVLLKPGYYNKWDSNESEFNIKDISSFRCIMP